MNPNLDEAKKLTQVCLQTKLEVEEKLATLNAAFPPTTTITTTSPSTPTTTAVDDQQISTIVDELINNELADRSELI